MRQRQVGMMPLARPTRGQMGSEAADFFNRFFVLYTPVIFADGEPLAPEQLVQAGLQAFRNVYAYPTREFALEVAARLADAVGADEHVEAWPVEVNADTRFALDERSLGWLNWLDGYEFPVNERRQWTMLYDGFVWPSVTQGIYATGATSGSVTAEGTSDFAFKLYEAYESLDPIEVRQRLNQLAQRYGGQALRGAMRTLPIILQGYEGGNVPPDTIHPALQPVLSAMPREEAVAKLLPPLRLIDSFTVHAEDVPVPPWLREAPDLEDYIAIATGHANREQRRRLLRARMVADLPALPGELAPQQTKKLLRRGKKLRLPKRRDVGTPRQYQALRKALHSGQPRTIRSVEYELFTPAPSFQDVPAHWGAPRGMGDMASMPAALERLHLDELFRCAAVAVDMATPAIFAAADLEDLGPGVVVPELPKAPLVEMWRNAWQQQATSLDDWLILRHLALVYTQRFQRSLWSSFVPAQSRIILFDGRLAADAIRLYAFAKTDPLNARGHLFGAVSAAMEAATGTDEYGAAEVSRRRDFLEDWWARCLAAKGVRRPIRWMDMWAIGDYDPEAAEPFYDPTWDYEVITAPHETAEAVLELIHELWNRHALYDVFGSFRWDYVDLADVDEVARYISGTANNPFVVIDSATLTRAVESGLPLREALLPSLLYALGAAVLDMTGASESPEADAALVEFADSLFAGSRSWNQAVEEMNLRTRVES